MRAAVIVEYDKPLDITTIPDPDVPTDGVVIRVRASGICRSDWHTWKGHDDAVKLPLVPGHEMAGEVVAVGPEVHRFSIGDRVTTPFVLACGSCQLCLGGNHQVCCRQIQPAVNFHGSFAQYAALPRADVNVAHLPDEIGDIEAASLGCRFITAFRAVMEQGRTRAGEWVAVHGCDGVGMSAIMIAAAAGARPIAVDINADALDLAREIGAVATIDGTQTDDVAGAIADTTGGGAHVAIDALGHPVTCRNAVFSLRTLGRHVQVGLMAGEHANTAIPMDRVISRELDIRGSHGMSPKNYPALFEMIVGGLLQPGKLIGEQVDLAEGAEILTRMDTRRTTGVAVITSFD